jgi:hypothetical protein
MVVEKRVFNNWENEERYWRFEKELFRYNRTIKIRERLIEQGVTNLPGIPRRPIFEVGFRELHSAPLRESFSNYDVE